MHCQKNQHPSTVPVFRDDSGGHFCTLKPRQSPDFFPPLGEQWIETLWRSWKCHVCVILTVHRRRGKETCTRTVGRAIPRAQCAAESHRTLSLCQLHVLWQHIKEEPGSLACEPCFVYPLPARNRTWHALLNKEFLRLWLQAVPLKSNSRQ